jgi:hypothetical protein
MSNQSTYHLAKFDQGLVYFIKDRLGDKNAGSGSNSVAERIVAIINVKEVKEHAQYQITVIETETAYKREYPIHGVYLTPNNILNIALSHIKRDDSLLSNLEKLT